MRPKYLQGYEINERMRALLIDWLIQVHSRFQLLQETLYLTVAILDRFLQVGVVEVSLLRFSLVNFILFISSVLPGSARVSQEAPACRCDSHVAGFEV